MRPKNPGIKNQRKPISERERGRQSAVRLMVVTLASLLPAEEMVGIMNGISRNGRTDDAKRSAHIMDTVFAVIQLEEHLKAEGVVLKAGELKMLFQTIGEGLPEVLREYRAGKK